MTGIKTRNKITHVKKYYIEHLLEASHSAGIEGVDTFPTLIEFILIQAGERTMKQSITKYNKCYD